MTARRGWRRHLGPVLAGVALSPLVVAAGVGIHQLAADDGDGGGATSSRAPLGQEPASEPAVLTDMDLTVERARDGLDQIRRAEGDAPIEVRFSSYGVQATYRDEAGGGLIEAHVFGDRGVRVDPRDDPNGRYDAARVFDLDDIPIALIVDELAETFDRMQAPTSFAATVEDDPEFEPQQDEPTISVALLGRDSEFLWRVLTLSGDRVKESYTEPGG